MSEVSVIIDRATGADAPVIAQLFLDDMKELGVRTTLDALIKLCESSVDAEDRGTLFLAARRAQGEPPFGALLACSKPSIRFGGMGLWVEELYVDPNARMGGTGRKLVRASLDWAKEKGLAGVDLEAYRMNTGASILYRSFGFDRLPRERYGIALDDLDLEA